MATPTTPTDDSAMAFLNVARQYQKAGSRLLDSVKSETEEGYLVPLREPIYFLFFHTVGAAAASSPLWVSVRPAS